MDGIGIYISATIALMALGVGALLIAEGKGRKEAENRELVWDARSCASSHFFEVLDIWEKSHSVWKRWKFTGMVLVILSAIMAIGLSPPL